MDSGGLIDPIPISHVTVAPLRISHSHHSCRLRSLLRDSCSIQQVTNSTLQPGRPIAAPLNEGRLRAAHWLISPQPPSSIGR